MSLGVSNPLTEQGNKEDKQDTLSHLNQGVYQRNEAKEEERCDFRNRGGYRMDIEPEIDGAGRFFKVAQGCDDGSVASIFGGALVPNNKSNKPFHSLINSG